MFGRAKELGVPYIRCADRSKYLIFLRTTFHVFLVDRQEVSGPVTDRDCLYMLILLNGRGIFNGKVSTERDRVIIGACRWKKCGNL